MKSVFKQLGKISFEDVKCVLMLMVTASGTAVRLR